MMKATKIRVVMACLAALAVRPTIGAAVEQDGWMELFNGKDMTGWKLQHPRGRNGWRVENGVYINQTPSTNIVSDKLFKDFELHCEYQMPKGSNSGIYMLNRYEVQLCDDYGKQPYSHMCGSLYGEITPTANACKPPAKDFPKIADDEWQTFDIKLRSARWNEAGEKTDNVRVTVIHNGVKIIDDQELKTPTGAARRYDEEAPGPIVLQGDHGPAAFRNVRIRGQVYEPPDPKAPAPAVIGVETEPKLMTDNKAPGVAVSWRTPNHAPASTYTVYRGESADFPLDKAHARVAALKRSTEDCCFEKDATYFYRIVAVSPGGAPGKPSDPVAIAGKANQVATSDLSAASWARVEGENTPSRKTAGRRPATMQGRQFDHGIGIQGTAAIQMYVSKMVGDSNDCRFRATVGMDDSVPQKNRPAAAVRFIVELDDKTVFDSSKMKWADGTKNIDVAVPAGSHQLVLRTIRAGERGGDNSDWGDPRLERASR